MKLNIFDALSQTLTHPKEKTNKRELLLLSLECMESHSLVGDTLRGLWLQPSNLPPPVSQHYPIQLYNRCSTSPLDHIQAVASWYCDVRRATVRAHHDAPYLCSRVHQQHGGLASVSAMHVNQSSIHHPHHSRHPDSLFDDRTPSNHDETTTQLQDDPDLLRRRRRRRRTSDEPATSTSPESRFDDAEDGGGGGPSMIFDEFDDEEEEEGVEADEEGYDEEGNFEVE